MTVKSTSYLKPPPEENHNSFQIKKQQNGCSAQSPSALILKVASAKTETNVVNNVKMEKNNVNAVICH